MPLPTCHTPSFVPPKGMSQLDIHYDPSEPLDFKTLGKDDEIWLFRIPADFPVTELHSKQLEFPTEYLKIKKGLLEPSAKKTTAPSTPVKDGASQKELFVVRESPESVGELRDMKVILPSSTRNAHQMVTRATSRFFSIEPKNLTFDMEALIKNSESARNSPYVERKHPLGLKLQSSPYGSGTDGETLAKTLSRYSDIISLISSEITPQPAKTSKRARSQKAEEEVIEADEETHKKKASNKKKVKV